jgi:single-stranded-DNA-specific exonuclease
LSVQSVPINGDEAVRRLQEHLGSPTLFAEILVARGFTDPVDVETFLNPKLEHLSDPFSMPDMSKGVDRVIQAVRQKECVALFADYDADGITSAALLLNFLTKMGCEPLVYIPKRKEGYGLNGPAIEYLAGQGTSLLICLDCGSSNYDEVLLAKARGMDVVILDHHETPSLEPQAEALINPKRPCSSFPTRDLAACGVVFFFLMALRRVATKLGLLTRKVNLKKELDLVTVGTVADMVPLLKDNRILVRFGLEVMATRPRTWLRTFLKKHPVLNGNLAGYGLGFVIIPRINAMGRVDDPMVALQFLLSEDNDASGKLLETLQVTNKKRQQIEETILKEALEQLAGRDAESESVIVLYKEDWPVGVIGIAAQRLAEMFKKPAVVITEVGGIWKGSARGAEGVDLHHAIGSVSSLLIRYGGHRHACGLSILEENLETFRTQFDQVVKGERMPGRRSVNCDATLSFVDLNKGLVEWLERLYPFGIGNPRPSFLLTPTSVSVVKNRFIRMTDERNRIWHGNVQRQTQLPGAEQYQVVASPIIRQEMGETFIHLQIRDIFPAETPV